MRLKPWPSRLRFILAACGALPAVPERMARLFSSDGRVKDWSSPRTDEFIEARSVGASTSRPTVCGPTSTRSRRLIDWEALMKEHGTLLHCDEAIRFIDQIDDPVTKNLVNMAFVHLVKTVNLE